MDFSPAAKKAARLALEAARRMGARVELIHVWEPPQLLHADVMVWTDGGEHSLVDLARAASATQFEALLAELGAEPPPTTRFCVGHAADVLTRESAVPGTSLLFVGAHGDTWLERALVGSVANQLLRTAACPVLTVRNGNA